MPYIQILQTIQVLSDFSYPGYSRDFIVLYVLYKKPMRNKTDIVIETGRKRTTKTEKLIF